MNDNNDNNKTNEEYILYRYKCTFVSMCMNTLLHIFVLCMYKFYTCIIYMYIIFYNKVRR